MLSSSFDLAYYLAIMLEKEQKNSLDTWPAVYIPHGTSIIQLLDISVNALFKAIVSRLANDYCAQNLSAYIQGTISAGERRVLLIWWVR